MADLFKICETCGGNGVVTLSGDGGREVSCRQCGGTGFLLDSRCPKVSEVDARLVAVEEKVVVIEGKVVVIEDKVVVLQESLVSENVFPSHKVLEATVMGEYAALPAADKENYKIITAMGFLDLSEGSNARTLLLGMFGAGTTTRINLIALVGG
jgi:hypothetical protein